MIAEMMKCRGVGSMRWWKIAAIALCKTENAIALKHESQLAGGVLGPDVLAGMGTAAQGRNGGEEQPHREGRHPHHRVIGAPVRSVPARFTQPADTSAR